MNGIAAGDEQRQLLGIAGHRDVTPWPARAIWSPAGVRNTTWAGILFSISLPIRAS